MTTFLEKIYLKYPDLIRTLLNSNISFPVIKSIIEPIQTEINIIKMEMKPLDAFEQHTQKKRRVDTKIVASKSKKKN